MPYTIGHFTAPMVGAPSVWPTQSSYCMVDVRRNAAAAEESLVPTVLVVRPLPARRRSSFGAWAGQYSHVRPVHPPLKSVSAAGIVVSGGAKVSTWPARLP